jgi:hypothetical protein
MTIRQLARELELSRSMVGKLTQRGMPTTSAQEAREWRIRCLRVRKKHDTAVSPDSPPAWAPVQVAELGPEQLEDTIPRLRALEKSLALAAERAFKVDKIAEAISLRREHVAAIKALYDAESKLIKINETRGRLISVDRALNMINEAMRSSILLLRRLPDLARTPEERGRLEAFLNAVLNEMKMGAAEGLKHAA